MLVIGDTDDTAASVEFGINLNTYQYSCNELAEVRSKTIGKHFFDVLLTVHLSIVLAIDQLNAQILVL